MKAIIFDMDGVLVNTPYIACEVTNTLLQNEDITFTQKEFKKYLKFGIEDRVKIWNKEFNKNIDIQLFFKSFIDLQVQVLKKDPNNNTRKDILTQLKNDGLKLGLATKAKRVKVDKVLAALDIQNIFDSIETGDITKNHKPHPEVYLTTLKNLNITSQDAIVIEDSPHGIVAAKKAGLKVLGYKTNVFTDEDLAEADVIITDLSEIFQYIN
ncbi:MAG: HAD family hydrolase [Candidatus Moraniibacteriota bacterium]|jgi:HAD superfamily hydrolase (TIGR01509 family)